MKSSDLFDRAEQFRRRGDEDVAEATLLDALEAAHAESDEVMLTRVRLALGELLHSQGRDDEAGPFLSRVIRTEREDGSVRAEVKRSAVLLAKIRGWRTD